MNESIDELMLLEGKRLSAIKLVKKLSAKRLPPNIYSGFEEGILILEKHCTERYKEELLKFAILLKDRKN